MEGLEQTCFQIISFSGTAKSMYIEAIQYAKSGDFEKADQSMKDAEEIFVSAHKVHMDLISKEAGGEKQDVSLLLIHAEDQMATCESMKILAQEIIDLYKDKYNK
jgi:PTS system cellobiose-specific IIA component